MLAPPDNDAAHVIRWLRFLTPTILVAGAVSTGAWTPSVGAATSCTITQVTDTADPDNFANVSPVISADGTKIAFESDQNHTGFNADGNQEIVLYDIAEDDFVRVSSTTGGTSANRSPSINANGSRVVWSTNRNIVGGNVDLNREIVRWTRAGQFSSTTFVTNSVAPVSNSVSTIDAAGDDIVYASGSDAGVNLFHHTTNGSITTQLTDNETGDSVQPFLNSAGSHLVFASDAAFDGLNENGGYEVFLYDMESESFAALTDTGPGLFTLDPVMSDNTRRVAFVSDAAFQGQTSDGSSRAFLLQRSAPVTTMLSTGETGQNGVGSVATNARGTRVAFESDGNHTGMNADGSFEVFVHDFGPTGEKITQVTDDTAGSGEVDIDASGRRIVFSSRGDHVGTNADGGREIFLAQCAPPPAPVQCRGLLVTVDLARAQTPTAFTDVIRGTTGADTVNALGGHDVFCGRGGADVFAGGAGDDWADGGAGPDTLKGGNGADRLRGGKGADVLKGMAGVDTCLGGPGQDSATNCETVVGVP